jgi:hypothetical protein
MNAWKEGRFRYRLLSRTEHGAFGGRLIHSQRRWTSRPATYMELEITVGDRTWRRRTKIPVWLFEALT